MSFAIFKQTQSPFYQFLFLNNKRIAQQLSYYKSKTTKATDLSKTAPQVVKQNCRLTRIYTPEEPFLAKEMQLSWF